MLPEVNLLPKYERSESVLYNIFLIGLIFLILSSGTLTYFYITTKNELDHVKSRVNELNQEKVMLETSISNMTEENSTDFEQIVAYVEQFTTPTSLLVDEVVTLLPEHSYLSRFSYDFHSAKIETQFETLPDSSKYVAALINSPLLQEVVINQINTFTYESEVDLNGEAENVIPRYHVDYSFEINHDSFTGEEEGNETTISGE